MAGVQATFTCSLSRVCPDRLHRPYMAVNIKRDFALDALCFHCQQMRQHIAQEEQQVSYLSQYG